MIFRYFPFVVGFECPLNNIDLYYILITFCNSIVQNASSDVVRAAYDVCFDAVVRIVLQSDDHSELQVIFFCCNISILFDGYWKYII